MIRNIALVVLASSLFLSLGIVSCNKEEKQPSLASKLFGKWKKVRYATDDNANGVLDEWEIHDVAPATINILEFRNDSSGTEYATNTPDLGFTWYINNELSLAVAYNSSETTIFKITRVNSGSLDLTTRAKNGLVGYYYEHTD